MICKNYAECERAGFTVIVKVAGGQLTCEQNPYVNATQIIEFPLIRYEVAPAELNELYAQLTRFEGVPQKLIYRPKDINSPVEFALAGCPVTFVLDDGSKKFTKLVDYFGEINRLKTRRNNQFECVYDLFHRVKGRLEVAKITTAAVYEAFMKFNPRFASEFNPAWMVLIIKYLRQFIKIERILDMSAGRGARAIGAGALKCAYFGCDPNTNIDYETVINFFNVNGHVEYSAFEKAKITGGQFDVMFSSPPYFDLEIYSDCAGDSLVENPSLEGWLNNFMFVSMDKVSDHLVPGGIMVINIDNPLYQDINYVQPLVDRNVKNMQYLGYITIFKSVQFTFFCWQKKKN